MVVDREEQPWFLSHRRIWAASKPVLMEDPLKVSRSNRHKADLKECFILL